MLVFCVGNKKEGKHSSASGFHSDSQGIVLSIYKGVVEKFVPENPQIVLLEGKEKNSISWNSQPAEPKHMTQRELKRKRVEVTKGRNLAVTSDK